MADEEKRKDVPKPPLPPLPPWFPGAAAPAAPSQPPAPPYVPATQQAGSAGGGFHSAWCSDRATLGKEEEEKNMNRNVYLCVAAVLAIAAVPLVVQRGGERS